MNDKNNVIERLSDILKDRKESSDSSSYTSMLYSEGIQKIISKIKEESNELIEAALNDVKKDDAIIHEAADLLFHVMVLLAYMGIDPSEILRELEKREGISGIEEKSKR